MVGRILNTLCPIFQTVFETGASLIEALMPVVDSVAETFKSLAPAIDFVAAIIKAVLIPAIQLLKPVFEIVGKYINGMIMVWSQTIGRLIEGILQGVSAVGKAMGQDMSAVDGMISSLQKMRDSSTNQIMLGYDPNTEKKSGVSTGQTDKYMQPAPANWWNPTPVATNSPMMSSKQGNPNAKYMQPAPANWWNPTPVATNSPMMSSKQGNPNALQAPNAGKVGLQSNTQVVNEINVSGIPGAQVSSKQKTTSSAGQDRKAPALSGYGK
jgi:hypothetical protein